MGGKTCDPREVALKGFFLGPQAENAPGAEAAILEIFRRWFEWRRGLFPADGRAISPEDQKTEEFVRRRQRLEDELSSLLSRFEAEVPKFSPRYIGHMFSEVSLPALFGHVVALLHNPNNVSGESSRVGLQIEDEAVRALLTMVGYDPVTGAGHFTSGGTIANFEALVRARARLTQWMATDAQHLANGSIERAHMGWDRFDLLSDGDAKVDDCEFVGPSPVILVSGSKHYSWPKGAALLGLGRSGLRSVELDEKGKLSIPDLRRQLAHVLGVEKRPVLAVVSIAGTTELGEFDPVHLVQDVLDEYREKDGIHIWHHVDAAYGGFFASLGASAKEVLSDGARAALEALPRADSITLDPHKLGYVPYASGAILVRDRRDYAVESHDAPYIDFNPTVDRGPFTLEGSRSAAGPTATWLTARTIGLDEEGYGRILRRTIASKRKLEAALLESGLPVRIAPHGESNILCFTLAAPGERVSASNDRVLKIFHRMAKHAESPFFLSKTVLDPGAYRRYLEDFLKGWEADRDTSELVLLRICLMNPFFDSVETKTDFCAEFVRRLKEELGKL